jgi:hypothetical protein
LSYSLAIFRFDQAIALFLLFLVERDEIKTENRSIFRSSEYIPLVMRSTNTDNWIAVSDYFNKLWLFDSYLVGSSQLKFKGVFYHRPRVYSESSFAGPSK